MTLDVLVQDVDDRQALRPGVGRWGWKLRVLGRLRPRAEPGDDRLRIRESQGWQTGLVALPLHLADHVVIGHRGRGMADAKRGRPHRASDDRPEHVRGGQGDARRDPQRLCVQALRGILGNELREQVGDHLALGRCRSELGDVRALTERAHPLLVGADRGCPLLRPQKRDRKRTVPMRHPQLLPQPLGRDQLRIAGRGPRVVELALGDQPRRVDIPAGRGQGDCAGGVKLGVGHAPGELQGRRAGQRHGRERTRTLPTPSRNLRTPVVGVEDGTYVRLHSLVDVPRTRVRCLLNHPSGWAAGSLESRLRMPSHLVGSRTWW